MKQGDLQVALSQGKSRPFRLSLAVACTLLASGGFVGAGYAGNSAADTAAAKVAVQPAVHLSSAQPVAAEGLESIAPPAAGIKVSFADTLFLASKPKVQTILDLTDPNAGKSWPSQLARPVGDGAPEVPPALVSEVRKAILAAAYRGLGHSYVWGGTSFAAGWDCSGFVQWAYAQAGVALPRTEQWLPMEETNTPQPGDLVVQNPDGPYHWAHIGIYVGNGMMISALNPSVGTIMHTPASTSSSSAYFTMPGFALGDGTAAKAKPKLKAAGSASPSRMAKPAPRATPQPTTVPPTARPGSPAAASHTGTAPPSPSETAAPIPSPTANPTPTPTPSPTSTRTPSPTPSPTSTPTPSTSPAASAKQSPTEEPSATATPTPSPQPLDSASTAPGPNPAAVASAPAGTTTTAAATEK